MEFRIGDRVSVDGEMGTVIDINSQGIVAEMDNVGIKTIYYPGKKIWWLLKENFKLERRNNMFTKDDLKEGMIVEYRNGKMRFVLAHGGTDMQSNYTINNDLTNNITYGKELDIVKVYPKPTEPIWVRPREPRKVTMSEVNAKFGEEVVIEEG